jgi:hypothetical protein
MREMRENWKNYLKLRVLASYILARPDGLVSRPDALDMECPNNPFGGIPSEHEGDEKLTV